MHPRAACAAGLASLTAATFVFALANACGHRLDLAEEPDASDVGADATSDVTPDRHVEAGVDATPSPRACSEPRFEGASLRTSLPYSTRGARSVDFTTWYLADATNGRLTAVASGETRPWMEAIGTKGELPTLSPDQLLVVFQRTADGPGGTNIGGLSLAMRGSAASSFDTPTSIAVETAIPNLEVYEPYLVEDGGVRFVYFTGISGGVRALYESRLDQTAMGGTGRLVELKRLSTLTGLALEFPLVSRDRLEIFFSDRSPGMTKVRHALRQSVSDPFDTPTDVALPLAPDTVEKRPVELSADSCTLAIVEGDVSTWVTTVYRTK